jgi:ABC-type multidrug transport system fused ATPase/permease subunit
LKRILANIFPEAFKNISYFYSYLKYRLFLIFILNILVGLMDGLGLSMFIPLLEFVSSSETGADKSTELVFLSDFIVSMGLPFTLTTVLLIMLSFFILKGTFRFFAEYCNSVFQQFFIKSLRVEGIEALSEYRFDLFVLADVGRIQNTMSGEVSRVNVAFRNYLKMIEQGLFILTYVFLASLTNPQFAVLVAVGGGLTNFGFRALFKKTKKLSKKFTNKNHVFQGLMIQQVAFFKYLKASGLIRSFGGKLVKNVEEIEKNQVKVGKLSALVSGLREPVLMVVLVSVILIQVNYLEGVLSLIILSVLFFYRALNSVLQLQSAYNNFLNVSGSLENMKSFVQELQNGCEQNGTNEFENFKEEISLMNISFAYKERPIIRNVSFIIKKNTTISFVGESGSGKTTLMNLVAGLLTPAIGKMAIDGQDYNDLDLRTFQSKIGYITQDPVVFDDTIYNNVTFWSPKTADNIARFNQVIKSANVLEFVEELTLKENTLLGNNGISLSGGQKQRISIARELYKDVAILLMDEATSALDSENENLIKENIESLKGKHTIIIIAHRLSTIKDTDRIILMKNGKISGQGSFDELFSTSQEFKRMVELQNFS